MAQQTVYRCDVTNEFRNRNNVVPFSVAIAVAGDFESLEFRNADTKSGHVSTDIVADHDMERPKMGFDELQIIVVDDTVVGYRNNDPINGTEATYVEGETREFLESLVEI